MTLYTTLLDASSNKIHLFVVQKGDMLFVECGLCRTEINWKSNDLQWYCANPECGVPYTPADARGMRQSALTIHPGEADRQREWVIGWTGLDIDYRLEWA